MMSCPLMWGSPHLAKASKAAWTSQRQSNLFPGLTTFFPIFRETLMKDALCTSFWNVSTEHRIWNLSHLPSSVCGITDSRCCFSFSFVERLNVIKKRHASSEHPLKVRDFHHVQCSMQAFRESTTYSPRVMQGSPPTAEILFGYTGLSK